MSRQGIEKETDLFSTLMPTDESGLEFRNKAANFSDLFLYPLSVRMNFEKIKNCGAGF